MRTRLLLSIWLLGAMLVTAIMGPTNPSANKRQWKYLRIKLTTAIMLVLGLIGGYLFYLILFWNRPQEADIWIKIGCITFPLWTALLMSTILMPDFNSPVIRRRVEDLVSGWSLFWAIMGLLVVFITLPQRFTPLGMSLVLLVMASYVWRAELKARNQIRKEERWPDRG